jgi:hypothetical protein
VNHAVYNLLGTNAFVVVSEFKLEVIRGHGRKLSAVFPLESIRIAVVIRQRVAYCIVRDASAAVRREQVSPPGLPAGLVFNIEITHDPKSCPSGWIVIPIWVRYN